MSFIFTKTSPNDTVSRQTTSPNSAEIIAGNDDLLNEILLRLPIKTMIRFKSVSKHWRSLISDPKFSQRYNPNPNPNPSSASGLFLKRSSRPEFEFINLNKASRSNPCRGPFRSLNFADDLNIGVDIVQSCNGLLLCSTNQTLGPREYYVYNPTVNQYTILSPSSPIPENVSKNRSGLSLVFDPCKSPHYNVVHIRRNRGAGTRYNQFQIEIYSSETRRWRLCSGAFFVESLDIRFDGGVFWKGSVHWLSFMGESVYFNVEEEKLSAMPMPPVPDYWDKDARKLRYFGESRGHLHLIHHNFDPQTPHFDVYEMELDYSGWIAMFRVDFSKFPVSFPERRTRRIVFGADENVFSLLSVVRSEVEEESYLVLQMKSSVFRYNFESRTLEKICDVEASGARVNRAVRMRNSAVKMLPLSEWYDVHQFIQSLALV